MSKFCLLMFSIDSNEGVLQNVRRLRSKVDEIVVIDSSNGRNFSSLVSEIGSFAKVYRVLPLGMGDLVRDYASSKVDSDYILNLDTDEEPTDEFIEQFRRFDEESAYLVGWYHVKLGQQAKKLILYRNKFVRWMGHVFEVPAVSGTVMDISDKYRILHHADFEYGYGRQANRSDRYFFFESIGRPCSWETVSKLPLSALLGKQMKKMKGTAPKLLYESLILGAFIHRQMHSPDQNRINRFLLEYGKDRLDYFYALSEAQRELFFRLSQNVYAEGGLIKYLRLDSTEYVDELTSTFDWTISGLEVSKILLMHKYLTGNVLKSFKNRKYDLNEVNKFWSTGGLI